MFCLLVSHTALFNQVASPALVLFYPTEKVQCSFRVSGSVPSPVGSAPLACSPVSGETSRPHRPHCSRVQAGACVSANDDPSPLPLGFTPGRHSSFSPPALFYKDVERRGVLVRLTKQEKGPKSYFPAGMFGDLTSSDPRKRKVKAKQGASFIQGQSVQVQRSVSRSPRVCPFGPGVGALSPPTTPPPSYLPTPSLHLRPRGAGKCSIQVIR